jgi:hydroxyacid-oxoacid transhydrogenase
MTSSARLARSVLRVFSGSKCSAHGHDYTGAPIQFVNESSSTKSAREYAFEFTASSLRFGPGVTRELGQDLHTFAAKKTLVVTDPTIAKLSPYHAVAESLRHHKCHFDTFDQVRVEPSQESFCKAIEVSKSGGYDSFVAVGGGSAMDTAKVCALFAANPDAELLDYVGPPFGRSLLPKHPMRPLICVPTTAGTGSETTAVSIFDMTKERSKTGIRIGSIKPHLGLVDPEHMRTMPRHVAVYSGFDVLCHALESFTNIPYNERDACDHPEKRPVFQGQNPLSDVWCREALRILKKYFLRSVNNPEDMEARTKMLEASSFAGMGFGNAGVHLCHGLSYSLSSNVRSYVSPDYPTGKPLIPHGLSVVLTAPADFELTGVTSPERHMECAQLLGRDTSTDRLEDAGNVLADVVRGYMRDLDVPNGLQAVGYTSDDTEYLAKAAVPTTAASKISPVMLDTVGAVQDVYKRSMKVY